MVSLTNKYFDLVFTIKFKHNHKHNMYFQRERLKNESNMTFTAVEYLDIQKNAIRAS